MQIRDHNVWHLLIRKEVLLERWRNCVYPSAKLIAVFLLIMTIIVIVRMAILVIIVFLLIMTILVIKVVLIITMMQLLVFMCRVYLVIRVKYWWCRRSPAV